MIRLRKRVAGLLAAAALAVPALSAPASPRTAPAEEARIVHALSRLTFGPRPADLAEVRRVGLEAWTAAQLHPGRIADAS